MQVILARTEPMTWNIHKLQLKNLRFEDQLQEKNSVDDALQTTCNESLGKIESIGLSVQQFGESTDLRRESNRGRESLREICKKLI